MPSGRTQVLHDVFEIDLTALAAGDAKILNGKVDASLLQGVRIRQMKAAALIEQTAARGPIEVGFCTGLSDAEVEECIEADPQGIADVPAVEQANRKVFPVWLFPSSDSLQSQNVQKFREVSFPWKEINEGQSLSAYAYNHDTVATILGVITIAVVYVLE